MPIKGSSKSAPVLARSLVLLGMSSSIFACLHVDLPRVCSQVGCNDHGIAFPPALAAIVTKSVAGADLQECQPQLQCASSVLELSQCTPVSSEYEELSSSSDGDEGTPSQVLTVSWHIVGPMALPQSHRLAECPFVYLTHKMVDRLCSMHRRLAARYVTVSVHKAFVPGTRSWAHARDIDKTCELTDACGSAYAQEHVGQTDTLRNMFFSSTPRYLIYIEVETADPDVYVKHYLVYGGQRLKRAR